MAEQVREPVQERSIKTKKKIIEGAYVLFSKVGYFNTNTAEIAKEAGVSTGIVYGYFKNKRDIMLDVLDVYMDKVYAPILAIFERLTPDKDDIGDMVEDILATALKIHEDNAAMHEALNSLSHSDQLVYDRFDQLEDDITKTFAGKFVANGYNNDDIYERVHVAMNIVHAYAQECVFDSHSYIDKVVMKNIVKEVVVGMFKK